MRWRARLITNPKSEGNAVVKGTVNVEIRRESSSTGAVELKHAGEQENRGGWISEGHFTDRTRLDGTGGDGTLPAEGGHFSSRPRSRRGGMSFQATSLPGGIIGCVGVPGARTGALLAVQPFQNFCAGPGSGSEVPPVPPTKVEFPAPALSSWLLPAQSQDNPTILGAHEARRMPRRATEDVTVKLSGLSC
jgi:hypothetical protein